MLSPPSGVMQIVAFGVEILRSFIIRHIEHRYSAIALGIFALVSHVAQTTMSSSFSSYLRGPTELAGACFVSQSLFVVIFFFVPPNIAGIVLPNDRAGGRDCVALCGTVFAPR